ncbi:MAG: hypothetical protein OXH15_14145 [Gammaproteobacteria bacterium]|nr:hypothetical protein [Gammaproteobacteria bacterium]
MDHIELLRCCFAVEVYTYCIMSNHFHLVGRHAGATVARRRCQ